MYTEETVKNVSNNNYLIGVLYCADSVYNIQGYGLALLAIKQNVTPSSYRLFLDIASHDKNLSPGFLDKLQQSLADDHKVRTADLLH